MQRHGRAGRSTHPHRDAGESHVNSHTGRPESGRDTEIVFVHRDTGAHVRKSLRGGSIDTRRHTGPHRRTRRYWNEAGGPNPPQSRAPPRGPTAQGATSDLASRRLQIRSALSPPERSGDPPPMPSAPAPLRAAALLREGPGPPRRGSRGQPAPAPGPHRHPPPPSVGTLGTKTQRVTARCTAARRSGLRIERGARIGGCQAPRARESSTSPRRAFAPRC